MGKGGFAQLLLLFTCVESSACCAGSGIHRPVCANDFSLTLAVVTEVSCAMCVLFSLLMFLKSIEKYQIDMKIYIECLLVLLSLTKKILRERITSLDLKNKKKVKSKKRKKSGNVAQLRLKK